MLDTKDNHTRFNVDQTLAHQLQEETLTNLISGQQELNIFLDLSQN